MKRLFLCLLAVFAAITADAQIKEWETMFEKEYILHSSIGDFRFSQNAIEKLFDYEEIYNLFHFSIGNLTYAELKNLTLKVYTNYCGDYITETPSGKRYLRFSRNSPLQYTTKKLPLEFVHDKNSICVISQPHEGKVVILVGTNKKK